MTLTVTACQTRGGGLNQPSMESMCLAGWLSSLLCWPLRVRSLQSSHDHHRRPQCVESCPSICPIPVIATFLINGVRPVTFAHLVSRIEILLQRHSQPAWTQEWALIWIPKSMNLCSYVYCVNLSKSWHCSPIKYSPTNQTAELEIRIPVWIHLNI